MYSGTLKTSIDTRNVLKLREFYFNYVFVAAPPFYLNKLKTNKEKEKMKTEKKKIKNTTTIIVYSSTIIKHLLQPAPS